MAHFSDLLGTLASYFKLGISGVRLKDSSGNLAVRNTGDSADAEITVSKINVSGNDVVINSDAAGSAADWLYTLRRPSSGMTAAVVLTLPVDDGTNTQVLQTDGSGNLSWVTVGGSTANTLRETTTLAFGASATTAMFNLPANAVIDRVDIIVDTAFNGTTPQVTVGISGTTAKYSGATDCDLKTTGRYIVHPAQAPVGSVENIIATYTASGASAGSARIIVDYSIPA